jgi:hypothetical protein
MAGLPRALIPHVGRGPRDQGANGAWGRVMMVRGACMVFRQATHAVEALSLCLPLARWARRRAPCFGFSRVSASLAATSGATHPPTHPPTPGREGRCSLHWHRGRRTPTHAIPRGLGDGTSGSSIVALDPAGPSKGTVGMRRRGCSGEPTRCPSHVPCGKHTIWGGNLPAPNPHTTTRLGDA